jgi:hypothetical protein
VRTILVHWVSNIVSRGNQLRAFVLPVSQPVGHDDSGGVLLERWNDKGSASHFEYRFYATRFNAERGGK